MRSTLLVAVLICGVVPAPAHAQALTVGDRIRVRFSDETEWIVGRVEGLEGDSLALNVDPGSMRRVRCSQPTHGCASLVTPGPASLRINTADLASVQRSIGTRRHGKRGALLGGLIGAAIGAYVYGTCRGCYSEWALPGAFIGGAEGALIGALVGRLTVTDVWQE